MRALIIACLVGLSTCATVKAPTYLWFGDNKIPIMFFEATKLATGLDYKYNANKNTVYFEYPGDVDVKKVIENSSQYMYRTSDPNLFMRMFKDQFPKAKLYEGVLMFPTIEMKNEAKVAEKNILVLNFGQYFDANMVEKLSQNGIKSFPYEEKQAIVLYDAKDKSSALKILGFSG